MVRDSKETLFVKELRDSKRDLHCREVAKNAPLIWKNGVATGCSKSKPFTLFLLASMLMLVWLYH